MSTSRMTPTNKDMLDETSSRIYVARSVDPRRHVTSPQLAANTPMMRMEKRQKEARYAPASAGSSRDTAGKTPKTPGRTRGFGPSGLEVGVLDRGAGP